MGETDLFGGMRISKDDCRVECYGTMDEVNSNIGLAYSLLKDEEMKAALRQVQKRLFVMGAELASDENGGHKLRDRISGTDVDFLEGLIDKYQGNGDSQRRFSDPRRYYGFGGIACNADCRAEVLKGISSV